MQSIVTIKGKEKGLEITLSEKSTYPVIREELIKKLIKNKNFFRDSDTKVVIRGKKLSEAQRKEIKRVFSMDYGIYDVLYGDEADLLMAAEEKNEPEPEPEPEEDKDTRSKRNAGQKKFGAKSVKDQETSSSRYYDTPSLFIDYTVRSGQRIECEGDVVVMGDVNPGGEIIAGGNIVVFGKLKGLAHAGCSGRSDVRVAAIYMYPKQLRLSGKVVTFPRHREDPEGPEIAELKDGKVVIRTVKI